MPRFSLQIIVNSACGVHLDIRKEKDILVFPSVLITNLETLSLSFSLKNWSKLQKRENGISGQEGIAAILDTASATSPQN